MIAATLPLDLPIRSATVPAPLAGRRAAVIALSYYPWDPRIRRETEALVEAGMKVELFCLQETPAQPRREIVDGVKVTRMRLRRSRAGKLRYLTEYVGFFCWGFWHLSVAGLRRRFALVHVHNVPDVLVFTSLVPRLGGARVILDLHDPMPELFQTIFGLGPRHPFVRLLAFAEQCSTHYANLVLTPNRAFRDLFVRRSHCAGKLSVVMNTPSDQIFPATAEPPAGPPAARPAFRLMYHGLIAERHGLDLLLQAVGIASAAIPEITLDIYGGRSPFLGTIEEMIRRLGLADRVRYHGKKSLAEIASIIRTVDLGVVPNRRTPFTELNFPTRIFEHLALRKPVITLNTEGVRDYFSAEEIFFVDSEDPVALAATIRRIHADPVRTRAIVARGYDVYQRHRWAEEKGRFVASVVQLVTLGSVTLG